MLRPRANVSVSPTNEGERHVHAHGDRRRSGGAGGVASAHALDLGGDGGRQGGSSIHPHLGRHRGHLRRPRRDPIRLQRHAGIADVRSGLRRPGCRGAPRVALAAPRSRLGIRAKRNAVSRWPALPEQPPRQRVPIFRSVPPEPVLSA